MPKKLLTDAEKNRQAIINKTKTGTVQATTQVIKPVTAPKPLIGIDLVNQRKKTIADEAAKKAGVANPDIVQQYDTVNASAGSNAPSASTTPKQETSTSWLDYSKTGGTYDDWSAQNPGVKDATVIVNEATGKPFTYDELAARDMLTDQFKKADADYFAIYGKHLQSAPSDLESASWSEIAKKQAEIQTKKQQEEMAYQQQQAEIAKELDQSQLDTASKQSQAAIAATEASIGSADREGVVSAGNRLVSSQFTSQMDKNMREMTLRVESAQIARDKALKDLEAAHTSQNEELSAALAEQLAGAEEALTNAQAARDKEASAQSAVAFDRLSKLSEISKNSGGGIFTGWTPDDIASTLGVDIGTASMVANIDARIASMDTSDIDYAQKVANLQKTQQEAIWSGMTTDQRNYQFYSQLLKIDPEAAKVYAQKVGFAESTTASMAWDKQMENNSKAAEYYSTYGASIPLNSKYKFNINGDKITIDAEEGEPPSLTRWQCGEFVNDILLGGPGLFGNYLDDKPTNSNEAKAGSAVVFDKGPNGHVAFIESVNSDGSFNIIDSNRLTKIVGGKRVGIVSRMTVRQGDAWYSKIKGFYDPNKGKGGSNLQVEQEARALTSGMGGSDAERNALTKDLIQRVNSGQAKDVQEAKKQLGFKTASDKLWLESTQTEITPLRTQFNETRSKIASIPELLESKTGVADLSAIVNFLKTTDPRSIARETEVDAVANAMSLVDTLNNKIQKAGTGMKLTDDQRANMIEATKTLSKVYAGDYYSSLITRVKEAEDRGIEPTFATKSEISNLEKLLGDQAVNEIKSEYSVSSEPQPSVNHWDAIDTDSPEDVLNEFNIPEIPLQNTNSIA